MGKKTTPHPQSDRWGSLFVGLSGSQWEVFNAEPHHYLVPHSEPGSAPLAAYKRTALEECTDFICQPGEFLLFLTKLSPWPPPPPLQLTWLPCIAITFPLFRRQTHTLLESNSLSDVAISLRTSRQGIPNVEWMTAQHQRLNPRQQYHTKPVGDRYRWSHVGKILLSLVTEVISSGKELDVKREGYQKCTGHIFTGRKCPCFYSRGKKGGVCCKTQLSLTTWSTY